jgi:hypothetical protein
MSKKFHPGLLIAIILGVATVALFVYNFVTDAQY